jgi:hypothetical protein
MAAESWNLLLKEFACTFVWCSLLNKEIIHVVLNQHFDQMTHLC